MKIEKEYNVQELANEIKGAIKNCFERGSSNALINSLTAQKIIDVLETVASWENKRTEACDTTKEALKQSCFGTYDEDDIECQCCDSKKGCKMKCKEMRIEDGKSEYECFGSHINGNRKCNLCIYERLCMIETEEKEAVTNE